MYIGQALLEFVSVEYNEYCIVGQVADFTLDRRLDYDATNRNLEFPSLTTFVTITILQVVRYTRVSSYHGQAGDDLL